MCGRFTNRLTWREIVALYRLSVPASPERNLPARYNICPTDTIDTVVEEDGKRDLVPMRWGLVPWWWKKRAKDVPATFNARAETIAEKPMFRVRSSADAASFSPRVTTSGRVRPPASSRITSQRRMGHR
jgi:putative SOS response-associated peptidase YedK